LGLDPLGLIASGALLVSVPSDDTAAVISALTRAGIAAAQIGRAARGEPRVTIRSGGKERVLRRFERDEIARLFE
jgi:hydrogenase maturation factor